MAPERRSTKAYDPRDAIWKVGVLADFGLDRTDARVAALSDRLFMAVAPDGTFRHGGFDHTKTYDARGYTCISHEVTGALARFGFRDDPRLEPAIAHIRSTQRLDGGWHPNAQLQPGASREADPSCPFGTVHVLRAAAAVGGELLDAVAPRAADYLLDCWGRRGESFRPVGFGMGTTFAKLAYPFATYGILSLVDALTAVPAARRDQRLAAMVDAVEAARGRMATAPPRSARYGRTSTSARRSCLRRGSPLSSPGPSAEWQLTTRYGDGVDRPTPGLEEQARC